MIKMQLFRTCRGSCFHVGRVVSLRTGGDLAFSRMFNDVKHWQEEAMAEAEAIDQMTSGEKGTMDS